MQTIIDAYFAADFEKAFALAREGLAQGADAFESCYVMGLLAGRAGHADKATRLIAQAEQLNPRIHDFEFLWPLERHRGVNDELMLWEIRLKKYVEFEATDAFIVSYPKCGRTWVRLMLGHYMLDGARGDPLELKRIAQGRPGLPRLTISHDDYPHWKPTENIVAQKGAYRDKSVVLLVRDPRDVIVSYFFQYTKRGDAQKACDSFSGTMSDFVRHPIGGIANIVRFYNVWAANRATPKAFLLQRYEDYHANPREAFDELRAFLGVPDHGAAALEATIAYGRFDNMRRLEVTGALNNARLLAAADRDPEALKTRKGAVGGFRDYLSDADIAWIDTYLADNLDPFFGAYRAPLGSTGKDRTRACAG